MDTLITLFGWFMLWVLFCVVWNSAALVAAMFRLFKERKGGKA